MQVSLILGTAVNAVAPILLLILLGYGLRRIDFINGDFIKTGNKLVFNICLPIMLFLNVYDTEGFAAIKWDVVVFTVCVIGLLFAISFLVAIAGTKVPERKGVVMQCVYRSNFAIIGLPLASALGGPDAMMMTAMLSAFSIPAFNVCSVISLTIFKKDQEGKKINVLKMFVSIMKNPLIIGVLLGLLSLGLRQLQLNLFGELKFSLSRDMKFLHQTLSNLKNITTAFALIILGGQFTFSAVKGTMREIIFGTLGRVVLAPIVGIGLAVLLSTYTDLLHCGVNEYPALIALFGSPMAVSGAVMAAEMKNDEQLATQLVVWTSLFSILTIFLTVCIMMPAGLLAT